MRVQVIVMMIVIGFGSHISHAERVQLKQCDSSYSTFDSYAKKYFTESNKMAVTVIEKLNNISPQTQNTDPRWIAVEVLGTENKESFIPIWVTDEKLMSCIEKVVGSSQPVRVFFYKLYGETWPRLDRIEPVQ
jgi:hypothetical protein